MVDLSRGQEHAGRVRPEAVPDPPAVRLAAVEASSDLRSEGDRRLHEFIDHMPAMVYMKGLDGELLLHNRKADELWGLSRVRSADGAVDPALHATTASPRQRRRASPASAAAHTFLETAVLADGKHWYSSIKFPVFDAAGEVYGVGAITATSPIARRSTRNCRRRTASSNAARSTTR